MRVNVWYFVPHTKSLLLQRGKFCTPWVPLKRLYLINGMDNGLENGMDYGLENGMDYGLEDGMEHAMEQ